MEARCARESMGSCFKIGFTLKSLKRVRVCAVGGVTCCAFFFFWRFIRQNSDLVLIQFRAEGFEIYVTSLV